MCAVVEIRTLDSFAWRLRAVFSILTPRSARSIQESNPGVADALETSAHTKTGSMTSAKLASKAHVFVDEAQDLVGSRAELVIRFLTMPSSGDGLDSILDPAQAIYEWSEEPGRKAAA